jgi:hypothetical protein
MPDISSLGDASELINRFNNKYTLYVEGPGDRAAYRMIVGNEFLIDHDFQVPPSGTGANAVLRRVEEERKRNKRVFGFLDGEAAATCGAAIKLVECDDLLFSVDKPDLDGIIFVAAHEMENLILSYCEVAPTIAIHKPAAQLADDDVASIQNRLETLTSRFLAAAMFKYTSLHFQNRGECVHVANTKIFGKDLGLRATLTGMKEVVTVQLKLDWAAFLHELFAITRAMRQRIAATPPAGLEKTLRHRRLADGKQLLTKVRGHANSSVEGHLLKVLARTEFAKELRDAIKGEIALAA